MLPPQVLPYAVLFASDQQSYNLATFNSPKSRDLVIKFLVDDLEARVEGDWFVLETLGAANATIDRVNELNGYAFDLPRH
jgi:hypothetical protein